MNIHLLGTGAADGIPALFLDDEVGNYARKHGGKDVRTRSAALIDGVLKIDLPPETLVQVNRENLDARNWAALLFTHSHEDHLAASEIQYALYPFTSSDVIEFTIFGNSCVLDIINARYPDWPLDLVLTKSFECFRFAEYSITPIRARHKSDEDCQNFIIDDGVKRVLYATDTGMWEEPTWEFLSDFKLDSLVIECTEGFHRTQYYGHLDLKECIQLVNRLREQGTLRTDSKVVTTHHSQQGGANHAQLEAALYPYQIDVGYDGLQYTI